MIVSRKGGRFAPALLVSAMTLLSACADNTANDFLCPVQGSGSPCTTIAQADGAGGGHVNLVSERTEDTLADTLSQEPLGVGKGGTAAFAGMPDGGFAYQSNRYRVPEVVGRIWIAPYHDENEILHESRYIHAVITEARWVNR